jgi:DNA-damage-inducible protein J
MVTTNLNIRTDKDIKSAAEKIYNELGLNMTTAVNMFLRQTIRSNGIPFDLKLEPDVSTKEAIKEGRALAKDLSAQGYTNIDDLKAALEQ